MSKNTDLNTSNTCIELVEVKKTDEHALALYELLKNRIYNISHSSPPSFEEHKLFVFSHPYRAWYLIRRDEQFVGSIYLFKSNSIGVSTIPEHEQYIGQAIKQLTAKYKPLPAIKSVRAPVFSVNVAPANTKLISILKESGGELAQQTYILKQ
jgi:hypothetical protein